MSVRHPVGPVEAGCPPTSPAQLARRRVLERAYPLAKQLAELLDLEAIEPWATQAKRMRQAIGAELTGVIDRNDGAGTFQPILQEKA